MGFSSISIPISCHFSMTFNKMLKVALLFEQRIKEASVRGNMAKRIMFSLLSHLVPEGESARAYYTHGSIDIKALRQLIPGAKELIEYGVIACLDELGFHSDNEAVKKVNNIASLGNDTYTLKALTIFYSRTDWDEMFGGEKWKKIAETLLAIKTHMDAGIEARKTYDLDGEIKELMNMTTYLNLLDGLVHNSGSLMQKVLDIESAKLDKPINNAQEQEAFRRFMDVKELKDPDDVLQEIMPILEKETDASLTMKDWMHAARRRRHSYETSDDVRNQKLDKIRSKKNLMSIFSLDKMAKLRKILSSFSRVADNMIADKLMDDTTRNLLIEFQTFISLLERTSGISNKVIEEIHRNYDSFKPLIGTLKQVKSMSSQTLQKNIWAVYDLLNTAENAFNALSFDE